MAVNIQQNGEFQIVYGGPYTGFNTMMPENLIPDSASPATNDFIFRNAELRSRNNFIENFITGPVAGGILTTLFYLQAFNGLYAVVQNNGLYAYSYQLASWTLVGGTNTSAFNQSNSMVSRVFNNVAFITGSGIDHLSTYDGVTFTLDNAQLATGPVTIGGTFIDELDNHLIIANTHENGGRFGNRIRWSATSLPSQWDPTANVNAGFNDFLDVPDGITGMLMLGRVGYILRTNGITEMAPTGRGSAPFEFNHLWASQLGIGSTKFYTSAQYGSTAVIISSDNIYSIQAFNLQAIGGGARDQILFDLGIASGTSRGAADGRALSFGVMAPFFASTVIPDTTFTSANLTNNESFVFLNYMLFLNIGNNCKVWIYSFDDNNWTNFILPNINVTAKPTVIQYSNSEMVLMVPFRDTQSGATGIGRFSPILFNDVGQGSSHSFKVEDVFINYQPTIRRVILTYRDMGPANVTATVTGTDDNGNVVTASTQVAIGSVGAPGILKTAFADLSISCFRPQLTISRAAAGGVVSLSTVTMIGRLDMGTTL
jgi:hypothetical protein